MKTLMLLFWSFFSLLLAPFEAMMKIAKPVCSKFGGFFRVVGLGLGRKGIQETRAGISLGRFRTADAIPSPQAYTYQAPAGVPGDITRTDDSNVEPAMLVAVASVFAQSFGIGMVYNTGGISQVGSGTAATAFAGVLVRQAPGISSNSDALTGNVPNPLQIQGLCVRGYVNVLCVYGTPVRGGVVYLRVNSSVNNTLVGTFDATSDSTDNVALTLTQASWASSGKDANNNAELRIAR